ncbi:MAG TPA: peptide chain release factor N(5)-glutamine methyltransferase [Gemmatimonas sp.]|uniref:peptide chain release factor N(5)-glutamine methyltransferase n=1 Tax=Gemmatimonas sp. TaxID=1962908 RepID=UPI002ED928BD
MPELADAAPQEGVGASGPVPLRDLLTGVAKALSTAPRDRYGDDNVDPALEARWLVSAVLDLSPLALAQRVTTGAVVDEATLDRIRRALHRRMTGEPLAYAVGSAAFRELVLQVDRRVLIPRPETEIVVGEALRLSAERPGGIAVDIGTGSGAIALSLAHEGAFDHVIATDISEDALDVARGNDSRLRAADTTWKASPVEFRVGADLAPVRDVRARVIVSNPPYIAYDEAGALPASVRDWEPSVALFAAERGMARYVALLSGAHAVLEPDGWIVLELDARRAHETAALARQYGFADVRVMQDLTGRERVLVARRTAGHDGTTASQRH